MQPSAPAMHLRQAGLATGRPLVFLHGWSVHGGFYAPQQAALGNRFRLLMPDLPGHGQSHADAETLSIASLADALAAMLAVHDIRDAVLVGWSMGAMVAFDYLGRHNDGRVSALVVEDMTARLMHEPDWPHGLRGGFDAQQNALVLAAMRADWAGFSAAFLPRMFAHDHMPDPALKTWIGNEIAHNDPAAMAALWASMAQQDYRAALAALKLPTLLLYGGESQLYDPGVSAWMQATIAGAERHCLARSGHAPHLEQPDDFNALLADFATRRLKATA
ncbi:alpha/beta fold hydrolase [Ferrovibrio sp.]|uniref:alpha/beta fold hydrolase n=1 Tax=Ferrovibrio sp. TaxID=1917215 RepID=UPI0035B4F6C3